MEDRRHVHSVSLAAVAFLPPLTDPLPPELRDGAPLVTFAVVLACLFHLPAKLALDALFERRQLARSWRVTSDGWLERHNLARALSQSDGQLIARRRRCLRKALAAPGWSRAQLALGWVLGQPGISSAVFGTTRPEHVRELALACTRPVPETVVDAIAVNAETRPDASETAAEAVICFGTMDRESGGQG